jgi:uncharacterized protein YfaS (alpha-2-macroglobulin family)
LIVEDFIPAGATLLNTNFNTTSDEVKEVTWGGYDSPSSSYDDVSYSKRSPNYWYYRSGWTQTEQRNDRVYLYAEHLSPWTYTYTYVLKAEHKWTFALRPAHAELLDKWEIWGRSNGVEFEIK